MKFLFLFGFALSVSLVRGISGPSNFPWDHADVPDSLMPLSAHHSPFEAGMFLVGSHLLQQLDRGTLLAYAWAQPNFHLTGLVSHH